MLRAASGHSGPSKANDEPDEKCGFLPVGFRARAHTEVRHSLDGRLGGQTRTFGGLDDIFQLERARRLRSRRSGFPANKVTEVRRLIDPTTATES